MRSRTMTTAFYYSAFLEVKWQHFEKPYLDEVHIKPAVATVPVNSFRWPTLCPVIVEVLSFIDNHRGHQFSYSGATERDAD